MGVGSAKRPDWCVTFVESQSPREQSGPQLMPVAVGRTATGSGWKVRMESPDLRAQNVLPTAAPRLVKLKLLPELAFALCIIRPKTPAC